MGCATLFSASLRAFLVRGLSTLFRGRYLFHSRPALGASHQGACATPRLQAMPDFFDVSRHFTPEERAIRDTVRAFVEARVLPVIGDAFEKGTFPKELIPEIAGLGLLGCNLHGYGCAGLSETGYGLAMQELER